MVVPVIFLKSINFYFNATPHQFQAKHMLVRFNLLEIPILMTIFIQDKDQLT